MLNGMKPVLYILIIVACLSLTLWTGQTSSSAASAAGGVTSDTKKAPEQCKPGKTSTQALGWRWRTGARVKVYYLRSHFSVADTDALTRAVKNWNDALYDLDSRIKFTVRGERESISEDDASITVMRGIPKGKDRVGELKYYSLSNGMQYMVVIVGPDVTDASALTSLMVHEIGHSLGLADCYGCQRGTTAMAAFRDNDKGNSVYAPSECDRQVVSQGYAGMLASTGQLVPAR
jgi:hypothetical protein